MNTLNRRSFFVAGASLIALGATPLHAENPVRLNLVLTNDLYKINEDRGRGGMARLAALLKAERTSGITTLFTHGGDALSPSLMSGFDKGEAMMTMLNLLRPDIFVPGNHEFDFGKDIFLQRMREAQFPLLAANLRMPDGALVPGYVDHRMIEVEGIRIGIAGATLDETPAISSPGDLQISDTLTSLQRAAGELRKNGADLTIAVVHANKTTLQKLANTHLFDLILSGHNHDLAFDYDGRVLSAESEEEARHIVIVELAMTLNKDKHSLAWWPNLRVIDSATLTPDPEALAQIKTFEASLSAALDQPVATLKTELDTREASVRSQETLFGDLLADALRSATKADIALTNGGGIRGDKTYAAGTILTRRDILSELPFGNRTVTTRISGTTLRAALENGLSMAEKTAGRFPQVSGLTLTYARANPPGQRLLSVEIGGKPLDDSALYLLATNDFMLKGGDGYTMLAAAPSPDLGSRLIANDMIEALTALATIDAIPQTRIHAQ